LKELRAIKGDNIKMDVKRLGCGGFHWIMLLRWWTAVNVITKILFPQMVREFVEKSVGCRFLRKGSKLLLKILILECHSIFSNTGGHI
jgi:hypothetical protein